MLYPNLYLLLTRVAAAKLWGAVNAGSAENHTVPVSKQEFSGDTALSKATTTAPAIGQIVASPVRGATAAAKIGNFPTLKTQRMLRRAQGSGLGGAEESSAFFDKFYSFGTLRRLCHRHAKKLAHEITRQTVSVSVMVSYCSPFFLSNAAVVLSLVLRGFVILTDSVGCMS
ncbi:unnamed protein product [Schistocephalus solidus]|uniref:Secreted protein n=1 Tax=Schistocephalus solidus TaxID=70667 RepID=A0A183TN61_SCHSO|nr:unnamed protein product [Schistocephalus solidus]